jgi:hypothetical protein
MYLAYIDHYTISLPQHPTGITYSFWPSLQAGINSTLPFQPKPNIEEYMKVNMHKYLAFFIPAASSRFFQPVVIWETPLLHLTNLTLR